MNGFSTNPLSGELTATLSGVAPMETKHCRRDVSVVIPVYNGSKSLPRLIAEISATLSDCCNCHEIILVDDSSPDGSWKVIAQLASQYTCVRGISLMRNVGQHNALLCGIRAAKFGVVVTMDDDLQN